MTDLIGDLTPMNILVKEGDGRLMAKVADFGLSKSKISKHSKDNAGTTSYQPPEHGQEKLSGAVDVFAFGGVLVFMFGEEHVHPFDDLDDGEIARKMIRCYEHDKPLVVPELETIAVPEVREIAGLCLSARSGSRPSARELLERFSELCGLSGNVQLGHAAEDVMMKVQMRTLNILTEEMASLKNMMEMMKERMREKDMEIDDLDVQMEFLMGQYTDSI